MGLLSLVLACTDPSETALAVCSLSPGLYEDTEGRTLLAQYLDTSLYEGGVPTIGHDLVGGRESLRGAACTLLHREDEQITMERVQPAFDLGGSTGQPRTVQLTWTVRKGLVDIGLVDALQKRTETQEAIREADLPLFAGRWDSLAASFPDPLLAVDQGRAQRLLDEALYRRHLVPLPEAVEEGRMVGKVENRGDRRISSFEVQGVFEGVQEAVTVELGELEAGDSVPFSLAIPPDSLGGYTLTVIACSF